MRPWSPFPDMADIVSPVENAEARVTHFGITERDKFDMMRQAFNGDRWSHTDPDKTYARLHVRTEAGWRLMMTDTDMEKATNARFLHAATGRVLVAGLGLGMVVHPLLAKPDVTAVVVVEKYAGVIAAIRPTLPSDDRLTLVHADIFEWRPQPDERFDTLYFDIWPNRSADNFPEINRLHRVFRKYRRTPESFLSSWFHPELKALRSIGRW